MLTLTFGGKPLLNPGEEAENLREHGKPVPEAFSRTNSLLNPLGRDCARGWLLMLRRDLDAIDRDALHNLVLDDGQGRRLTAYNLLIIREAQNLTPGLTANDPDACHLVEVADARWRCHNPHYTIPVSKQYNVRAPAYGTASGATAYYTDSLDGGSLWTWLTLVQDLWTLLASQLGTAPAALPFTPDGTPEGWIFPGVSAWEALCDVLDRIGCAVRWTPTAQAGAYTIVRVGVTDADVDATLAVADTARRKIYDAEFVTVTRGRIPANVRVYFHRQEQLPGTEQTLTRTSSAWQTSAVYAVDVVGPEDATDVEAGTYAVLWDDLPAIYDPTNALTNSAALDTRAAERADDYYRALREGGSRLHRTYTGLLSVSPHGQLRGVAWRQQADPTEPNAPWGLVTEIVRHPFFMLRVTDWAQWAVCCEHSTAIQPPDLGPTYPNPLGQSRVIELASGTLSGGFYDSTVEQSDGIGGFTDRESIWAYDLSGSTSLAAGEKYPGLLTGFTNSRPLYTFMSKAGTVSGPVTFDKVTIAPAGNTTVPLTINPPSGTSVNAVQIGKPGTAGTVVYSIAPTTTAIVATFTDPSGGGGTNVKTVNGTKTEDVYTGPGSDPSVITTSTTNTTATHTVVGGGTVPPQYGLTVTNTTLTESITPDGATDPTIVTTSTSTSTTNIIYTPGTTTEVINQTATTTATSLTLTAVGSQTPDLFGIVVGGSTVFGVDKSGFPFIKDIGLPADGDIGNSELFFGFDDTAGAPALLIKGKDSGGTVSTQSLPIFDPGADRFLFWDDSATKVTYGTFGTGLTLTDTTLTAGGGAGQLVRTKYTLDYTDFSDTDTQKDVEIYSLPAGGMLVAVSMRHTTAFDGTTTYSIGVGKTGTLEAYIPLTDVKDAPSGTNFELNSAPGSSWPIIENMASATSIRANAESSGGNLEDATQGVVEIELTVVLAP